MLRIQRGLLKIAPETFLLHSVLSRQSPRQIPSTGNFIHDESHRRRSCAGIAVMDATKLQVCQINTHKVFKEIAQRAKTSVDWFYGLKLPLVCNDPGELLNFTLTAGNTDDRQPVLKLLKGLTGKVLADRGYFSQTLFETLLT